MGAVEDTDYDMEDVQAYKPYSKEEHPLTGKSHTNVLRKLFRYLRDISLQNSTLDLLVTVSHVCKQWRNVALGSPELWANIPLNAGLRLAEVALERSQPEPIVVYIEATRHSLGPSQETVLRVLQDLYRARKFTLIADGWPSPDKLSDNFLRPLRDISAPRLEELNLVFRDAWPDAFGLLGPQPPAMLTTLTMHNAWFSGPLFTPPAFTGENLRTIRITGDTPRASVKTQMDAHGIPFPLPSMTLNCLTRLEARAQFPSLKAVHACLERMTALEHLQLSHFASADLTTSDWSDGLGTHFLSLPTLTRLSLAARADFVADLFFSLRLPISTKLSFICHLPSPRLEAFLQSMQSAVLAHYAAAPGCFKQTSIGENVRILYFSATDYEDLYKFYVELIDTAPGTSSLAREHTGFLHILLPSSPFRGLQTLYFNDVRVLEETPLWRRSCRELHHVTLVHIQARATPGLVDALGDTNLFPVLRTLSIKGDVETHVLAPLVQSTRQPPVEIRKR